MRSFLLSFGMADGSRPSSGLSLYKGVIPILYSDIKRDVLSHINQYTMAGDMVPGTYNNQADYILRIPQLINAGLVNIRTLVKPLPVHYVLAGGEEYGGFLRYELPEDFWKLKTGGVYALRHGKINKTNDYRLMGRRTILVPQKDDTEYSVEYYRYPDQLPRNAADSFDLREDIEVIQAAVVYAAANLVMQEDEFAYASLYNEFESQLSRMAQKTEAEAHPVEDAYWFEAVGGYDA